MRISLFATCAVLMLASAAIAADPADKEADKAAARQEIDTLIKGFKTSKTPATLGLIQRCCELSINFGAPAWNAGDHDACGSFYAATAESLLRAFPAEADATPAARAAIIDLKNALARIKGSEDVDKNAWTMRFAFDKTHLAVAVSFERADGLLALASESMKRGSYDDAEDAYAAAEAITAELSACNVEALPMGVRIAPIFHANALLAQKKYALAAAALRRGESFLPELIDSKLDLRSQYESPDTYEAFMDDLKSQVEKTPKDAGLQFLLAYELFFTGHKNEGKSHFEEALKLDPTLDVAKAFLATVKPGPTKKSLPPIRL